MFISYVFSMYLFLCVYVYVTKKISDAKVKRQGYKHALFGGEGVTFVWDHFSKIP